MRYVIIIILALAAVVAVLRAPDPSYVTWCAVVGDRLDRWLGYWPAAVLCCWWRPIALALIAVCAGVALWALRKENT